MRKIITIGIILILGSEISLADYTRNNNVYSKTVKADVRDKIDVEVGDAGKTEFVPSVKLMRWDNEVNLSVRLIDDHTTATVTEKTDGIAYDNGNLLINFSDLAPSDDRPEGGFEFDITLKDKPSTNIISFSLNVKGLEFFYQRFLKNQDKDGSYWEELSNGSILRRPENVAGSYAVYYKDCPANFEDGKLYRAGKVFHIYRPLIRDSDGKTTWGVLNIDVNAGRLTVTIPQEFLDSATYPIINAAGLEFGYHTNGASTNGNANQPQAEKATSTPASSGILTSLSIYAVKTSGSPTFCPALYSNSSGPSARLAYLDSGGTALGASIAWVTTNLSYASIVAGTQYWLGNKSGVNGATYDTGCDDGSTGDHRYKASEGGYADPFGTNTSESLKCSEYATYSVSANSLLKRNIIVTDEE
jgi:hypothetical protein